MTKSTCDIGHNLVQQDCTKHVEIDRFFTKKKLDEKIVELLKIWSEDQLFDCIDGYKSLRFYTGKFHGIRLRIPSLHIVYNSPVYEI